MSTSPPKGKNHCARHDVFYGALDQCTACAGDPGPPPDADVTEDPIEFPDGIPDPDEVLRGVAEDLDDMRKLRRDLRCKENGEESAVLDTFLANSIIKAQDSCTKLQRILLDAGYKRRDETLVDRREKRLTEAARRGAGR